MNEQTRALQAFAISRTSNQSVQLVFIDPTERGNGSYDENPRTEQWMATIADIDAAHIERLQEGGVDVREGVICAVPAVLESIPDRGFYNGFAYKVIDFSYGEGVTILTLSRLPMGQAEVDYNA